MTNDFSRFTNKSRNAIMKSVELTRQCQYAAIEPTVMMVAVLQEGDDMVPFLLNHMGIDKIAFFSTMSDAMQNLCRGHVAAPNFTQELQDVFHASIRLAEHDRHSSVALEYIFWAFAEVPNTVNELMSHFGITSQKIAQAVHAFQHGEEEQRERPTLDNNDLPNLHKFGMDLIRMAEEGEIDPVIGRDKEIRRILEIISRKTKNNPVLIGEPGTGKTAIVEGLAHRIVRGDVPQSMRDLRLFSVDISSILAGAEIQGEFEKRLKMVIEEAESDSNIILFVDEIHLLIGAGKTCGAMDAANILKPELARGLLKIIGATTLDEYRQIENDKAFERRFQKVMVDEPDVESAISILRGVKGRFENHHHIKILDNAVVSAVNLSHRYIADRYLPDKAIDLLDEAASSMRIDRSSVPHDLEMLRRQIRNKEIEKESLIQDGNTDSSDMIRTINADLANLCEKENVLHAKWQNERRMLEQIQNLTSQLERCEQNIETVELQGRYSEVVELKRQANDLRQQIDTLTIEVNDSKDTLLKTALDEKDIMKVVTAWTGIPMTNMTQDENERLLHIEEHLHNSVIGQDLAVTAVSNAVRRSRMGLSDANKPIGTFLFLGTTGVGKTELCRALAEYLFGSRDMMVRIDMSEYQQEHSVARLFGAPPGYVGYGEGGQLTETVRRKPFSVVLFDEIEKAHPKVFETLLQVLDDGRMTDGQGRLVDFKNTIIIMTSNIGQEVIQNNLTMENPDSQLVDMTTDQVLLQLRQRVAPEFINRIDDIIMFTPLGMDAIKKIVEIQLATQQKKFSENKIDVRFDDSVLSFIAHKAYSPEYGARPVRRAIKENIVDALCMSILRQEVNKEQPIVVRVDDNQILISNQ
jgi:ATP-dependent Clp protease ATP-binding subunit ClpB